MDSKAKYRSTIVFVLILTAAAAVRLIGLGTFPGSGALNQDEAYAGYEAWSMLKYGFDSDGYVNPVYFVAWGSGMNVLESYCMMPFIAVLGLNPVSIRMPSALTGILTVLVLYLFVKRFLTEKYAAAAAAVIAVVPWHIMISRWGLESNFLPAFILFGMYFLARAKDNSKFALAGMFFYGLSLYAYAAAWAVIPLIIVGEVVCLFRVYKIKWDIYWTSSVCILMVLGIPLVLYVLVNSGYLEPIRSGWISVPEMTSFRGGEVNFKNINRNLRNLLKILIMQDDGLVWNGIPLFGMYYYVSGLFILAGIFSSIRKIREKTEGYCLYIIMWIQLGAGILLGCMVDVNINRVNIIHIPLLFFCAAGIGWIIDLMKGRWKKAVGTVIGLVYAVCFISFTVCYFTDYNQIMAEIWGEGLPEAVAYAEETTDANIYITGNEYPNVLVCTQYPTDQFVNEIVWVIPDALIRDADHYGRYYFQGFVDRKCESGGYICRYSDIPSVQYMIENEMEIRRFGTYMVGIVP